MKDGSFALLYCHRQAMGFSESEYSSKDAPQFFLLVELNLEFFVLCHGLSIWLRWYYSMTACTLASINMVQNSDTCWYNFFWNQWDWLDLWIKLMVMKLESAWTPLLKKEGVISHWQCWTPLSNNGWVNLSCTTYGSLGLVLRLPKEVKIKRPRD